MKKGPLYVMLCYVLWGIFPIFWKQLQEVNSLYVLASRIAWSFIFYLIIILLRKEGKKVLEALRNPKSFKMLLFAGIMLSVNWGFYIIAVHSNRILESSLAYYMNPILAVIIGFFIFKEKLSKQQGLSIVLAIIGVSYNIIMYGKVPIFALIIGISFAMYGATKKVHTADTQVSLFIEVLFLLPFAIIYILWSKSQGITGVENLQGLNILYLPLSGAITAIPLLFYAEGMKTTSLTTAGILMYINPTLQLLIGILIYNELFTKVNAITFIFVWLALIIYMPTILKNNNK